LRYSVSAVYITFLFDQNSNVYQVWMTARRGYATQLT